MAQTTDGHGVDVAALLGAAIVVLLTLTFGPGAWGSISTIVGLSVLSMLFAYFWPQRKSTPPRGKWESRFVGLALSAVVGLVGAITVAQPVQLLWFRDSQYCRGIGVAQATIAAHDLSETLASKKSTLLPLVQEKLGGQGKIERRAQQDVFNRAYKETSGDCLAGATFEHLWWAGVPLFLFTLAL